MMGRYICSHYIYIFLKNYLQLYGRDMFPYPMHVKAQSQNVQS